MSGYDKRVRVGVDADAAVDRAIEKLLELKNTAASDRRLPSPLPTVSVRHVSVPERRLWAGLSLFLYLLFF